jgi:choline monooxygenase
VEHDLPPFEKDLARAHTLPARCYTDARFFALERERIFARTWQPVGRVEQVRQPGDFFTAEVAGEPVVVLRDLHGDLRAFANVCRHRAGAVAEGCGNRKALRCAYHGWTYALDGSLLGTPEFDGVKDFDRTQYGLPAYRVATWGPLVFVNLDRAAPALEEVLGAIPEETRPFAADRLVLSERREYVVRCNWKVYIDNYLEGYHVPVAHPGLFRELDYAGYRVETFQNYSKQHAPIRAAHDAGADHCYEAGSQALYYWIFPNWMLNLYPGNLQVNIVIPVALEQTLTIFEWYFPEGNEKVREEVDRAIAFGDQVQREDIGLCEAVQTRLRSRTYDRGRFSVKRENGVHHFQGLVHEFLRRTEDR